MKFAKTVAVISVFVLLLGLTSCAAEADSPEKAAEGFLKYFTEQKYSSAFEYVETYDGFGFDNRDESGSEKIIDAVAASTSYEVIGRNESETPVEVTARVTSVDLRELYKTCAVEVTKEMFATSLSSTEAISEKKFRDKLDDAVVKAASESGAAKITTEVTFKMEESNGKWFIVMDDLTLNNFCGHIIEANQWVADTLSGKEPAEEVPEDGAEGENGEEQSSEKPEENKTESKEEQ